MSNLPATQMTAAQQRQAAAARKADEAKAAILSEIERRRSDLETFLQAFSIPYELFIAGLLLFLSRQEREQPEFFDNLHMPSFLDALTRIATNGLIPDGKEAAIAAYKNTEMGGAKVAQAMFMREGFVKVLWRTGLVASINDQVVTEKELADGRFEYEEGDNGFIRHRLDVMRKDTDPVAAAYCIVRMNTGEDMREVVPKDELNKMAAMSRSPARKSWQHQMHRKGAIRRLMGKMPREAGIVRLLADDALTYRSSDEAVAAERPSTSALFSNKPVRRKKQQAKPLAIEQGADLVVETQAPDMREAELVPAGENAVPEQQEQREAGPEKGFVLQAVISRKNGVQQYASTDVGADLWFADLQEKMKRLKGEPLGAFWRANQTYIRAAGMNGHSEAAMKLVALAREFGLVDGGADAH